MKHAILLTVIAFSIAGCGMVPERLKLRRAAPDANMETSEGAVSVGDAAGQIRPVARPLVRQEADAGANAAVSGKLGMTIASLGAPAEPGLWLKTPLVSVQQAGRVRYGAQEARVTLLPLEGPRTAGSRMSLAAFQALGIGLTELPEISVSSP